MAIPASEVAASAAAAFAFTAANRSCIIVSPKQRGNPVRADIRNVRWAFGEITPDCLLSPSCALSPSSCALSPSYPSHRTVPYPSDLPCCIPQRGNPVLSHIRNVRWVFGEITPDYLLSPSSPSHRSLLYPL
ncbi:unnamed protein product [Closterium sp. NIES-54]